MKLLFERERDKKGERERIFVMIRTKGKFLVSKGSRKKSSSTSGPTTKRGWGVKAKEI